MFSKFLSVESVREISQEKLIRNIQNFISDKDLLLLDKGRSEREKSFCMDKRKRNQELYSYYSS
ncbi:hypothetical protein [Bacteroidetes bacterium endosymbiont of Geopemphigus sp.]|uniref:hypothetical protein n=1 Tax=Bacteroidetes bacterium endosymbiont of Geopemphigus sp. TaxID=2047937 RepID=UPI000CCFE40B|nr:hypothetical protein [Bacteroidetes bacterium endosymbiont of Geopemphigus sp.]